MKALIVDDSEPVRMILQVVLEQFGQVDMAVNGKEAVNKFGLALDASAPYDIVFLDIMMPEMNGQDALKEFRAMEVAKGIYGGENSKVVMVTSVDSPESVLEAYNEDCEAYLVKPVGKEKVYKVLRKFGMTPERGSEK